MEAASSRSFKEDYNPMKSKTPSSREILLQCEIAKLQEQLVNYHQIIESKKEELLQYRLHQCENNKERIETLTDELIATRCQTENYIMDIKILKKELKRNYIATKEKIEGLLSCIILLQDTCSKMHPANTFVWECPKCKYIIPINIIIYHLRNCYA